MEQKENNQDLLDRLDAVEAALDTLLNSITEEYNSFVLSSSNIIH